MNVLYIPHLPEVIGLTILHSLWQITLLWLLLITVLRLWPQAPSTLRYTLSLIALALCVVATGVTACYEWNTLMPTQVVAGGVDVTGLHDITVVAPKENILSGVMHQIDAAAPLFAWLWFVGLAIMVIRFAGSFYYMHALRRPGTLLPVAPGLQQRFEELTAIVGLRRRVVLAESARISSPLTMGTLSPVVLLPVGLVSGLSTVQLESVIVHELYHIKRHDYLVNLLQAWIEVVLFYHPSVWHISRIIREERENCCDDLTLAFCGDPLPYARALTQIHETNSITKPTFAMSVTGPNGLFATRIKRLFNIYPNPLQARSKGLFASGMLLTCMGLLLMSANAFPVLPKPAAPMPEKGIVKADTVKPAPLADAEPLAEIRFDSGANPVVEASTETTDRIQVTADHVTAVSSAVTVTARGMNNIAVFTPVEARARYIEQDRNGGIEIITAARPASAMNEATASFDDKRSGERVTIRVTASSTQQEPLMVVDGVVVSTSDLRQVNPQDIESISVYKDEEAVKKYGEAGAHGVVEVTMKGTATVTSGTTQTPVEVSVSGTATVTSDAAARVAPVEVQVYPNSAHDTSTVSFTVTEAKSKVRVTVADSQGNVVHREEGTYSRGKHDIALDLSTYKKGVYIVTIALDAAQVRQRLLVE